MKVLIIYAHPTTESFNHALLEAFQEGLKKGGHEFQVADLYRDGFNPVLDFAEMKDPPADVKAYQEQIGWADALVFIYPTFWFRAPAILEGFIDRVMSRGFAFRYEKSRPVGLLKPKRAVVMETYGGPGLYYNILMSRVPWRRFAAVLKFCGLKIVGHLPCYYIPFAKEDVRKKYLEKARQMGEGLK